MKKRRCVKALPFFVGDVMSVKRDVNAAEKINRIPDYESLFTDGDEKTSSDNKGFITKLLRRDWLKFIYSLFV